MGWEGLEPHVQHMAPDLQSGPFTNLDTNPRCVYFVVLSLTSQDSNLEPLESKSRMLPITPLVTVNRQSAGADLNRRITLLQKAVFARFTTGALFIVLLFLAAPAGLEPAFRA